jgi:hypothetical protein
LIYHIDATPTMNVVASRGFGKIRGKDRNNE